MNRRQFTKTVLAGAAIATVKAEQPKPQEFPGPGVLVMLEVEPEWKIRKVSRTIYQHVLLRHCARAKIELVHLKFLTPDEVSKLKHIETITVEQIQDTEVIYV